MEEDERTRGRKMRACNVTGGTGDPRDDRRGGGGRGGGGYGRDDDRGDRRGGGGKGGRPGDWDCPECSFSNFASRDRCLKCQCDKPRGGGGGRRDDSRRRGRDDSRRRGGGRDRSRGRN